ncbi:MAG: aminoacyl-tRNA hydrolase [Candidatus Scalindua sp. AMX11]|nr:MAG: aminoacyl-tRNA hydrolase [Candidatus Scalindua sp.]NOG85271.1 aminoacyl-tRNA hydrolase [Planctomycetota bacterium]RZV81510.1 MAG: aminoacyl-tRNA hydrolase [Candidatus Scalindua sp. SCAELEC01]TDE65417.1 MAG: aminoacyl-tRNA hydrolase [Candidatus Scalindua sp. AMX11]GJQ59339.1 MAG: peptidyl-tRNA hydrolase [Candidatus Scalindua sp.]
MKVVVGLGNPGGKYSRTRHNIGFMVVDKLVKEFGAGLIKSQLEAAVYECVLGGERVVFVKPQTFMNLSGVVVRKVVGKYGCGDDEVLVVLDDSDLPLGKIRVREQGGSGGHNGLRSIIDSLGSCAVPRLKIGIGHCPSKYKKEFVLSHFAREEAEIIAGALDRASEAVGVWCAKGIIDCMNIFN